MHQSTQSVMTARHLGPVVDQAHGWNLYNPRHRQALEQMLEVVRVRTLYINMDIHGDVKVFHAENESERVTAQARQDSVVDWLVADGMRWFHSLPRTSRSRD